MIFIVRHCQTEENEQKILCSNTDKNLSTFGIKQAELVANFFVNKDIDCILTSDLKRAVQTANLINTVCNTDLIECSWLRERYIPNSFSNQKCDDLIKKRKNMNHQFIDPSQDWFDVNDVESDSDVHLRFFDGVSEYIKKDRDIICVTHAGVIKSVLHSIFEISPQRTNAFKVRNGCIISLKTNGGLENAQIIEVSQIE